MINLVEPLKQYIPPFGKKFPKQIFGTDFCVPIFFYVSCTRCFIFNPGTKQEEK